VTPTQAEPAAAEPMVRLDRVGKRFGDHLAVDDVSFALATGHFLTILGPSGSGKTTVLRMIAGFIAPTSGGIAIHGRPVAGDPPYARSIGMVFQRLALFPHLCAADNVAYPLRMRGWPKPEIAARENAAANCGAPPLATFFTVTLPAVMPGVITGGLLMFILALNEFIVSLLLVDARIVTLPVLMYNSIRAIITPDLAALSVVYIAIAAVSIWLLDRLVGLEIFLKSK
jgi:ABC-type uncharacterized transport system YnjBCD ATPase subunit